MTNFKKIFPWLLVGIWMAIIFYLSHQPATSSNKLSSGITEWIIGMVEGVLPNLNFDLRALNHIIRKNAHFIAYFILGLLVVNAKKRIYLAFLICVLYAISDEFHQLFVPGRAGQIKDVFIDSAGALTGILVYSGLFKLKFRSLEEKKII